MATISSYFGAASGRRPDSDRVILAPTYISPRPNDPDGTLIEPDEFKLNGKQYVRYSVVAKSQKHTKKRTSVVWQYGEDIQLKQDPTKTFWYCYLCEQQQRQQGLPISGKGNCTTLNHLESKHQIIAHGSGWTSLKPASAYELGMVARSRRHLMTLPSV
ncbi:hypothetical protein F5883DRAFT_526654 [Diaporthe sp. PMI_573]|jgi:hypothetical protein|nr:hypothetical protein F5883DRAFT_526654 [Diaporthaceae sp. PMI_573]